MSTTATSGRRSSDRGYELVCGADLREHLHAGFGEDAREPLAKQRGVVGEHYAHGIAARTCVPPPTGLSTEKSPSSAWTRSTRPRSPEPRDGSAPPTPSSSTRDAEPPVGAADADAGA